MIALGLMSGTSLDGIDAALVEVVPRGDGYRIRTLHFTCVPYEPALERTLRAALPPNPGSAQEVASLQRSVGAAFAAAAVTALQGEAVDYVASHGHTLFHDGDAHVTLQVGDAFAIREAVRASVCYDFRSADCAVGGQGAPLVPFLDALLFASAQEDRVTVNLGGIANVTLLARGSAPVAFDTGPGNMLVDALMRARTRGEQRFDSDGACAAAGRVDEALLNSMLSDEYFGRAAPKSTGRERFGEQFLEAYPALSRLSLEDAAATLTELTVASVAGAIDAARLAAPRVFLSGGGTHNAHLVSRLRARLEKARVETTESMGIAVDAKEAIAFAVLGYETLRGRAANVRGATGARSDAVLGAIAPYELRALLERVQRECAVT